jgi:hypothetical protein
MVVEYFSLCARCNEIASFPEDTSSQQGFPPRYPPKGATSAQSNMEKFLRVNLLGQRRPQAMREGVTQARDSDEGREHREIARELLWREPGPEYGADCANR